MNDSNSDLYEKLSKLQWLLHKRQLRVYAAGGPLADTTRGQGRILALLKRMDNVSTKELSYLLGIRVSSLNELLSKLEKGGYIVREASEADKRVMLLKLTEKGRNEESRETEASDFFSCLSEEEQQTFEGYLDRIIAALETEFGDDSDDEFEKLRLSHERRRGGMMERLASMIHGHHDHHNHHDHHDHHDHGTPPEFCGSAYHEDDRFGGIFHCRDLLDRGPRR